MIRFSPELSRSPGGASDHCQRPVFRSICPCPAIERSIRDARSVARFALTESVLRPTSTALTESAASTASGFQTAFGVAPSMVSTPTAMRAVVPFEAGQALRLRLCSAGAVAGRDVFVHRFTGATSDQFTPGRRARAFPQMAGRVRGHRHDHERRVPSEKLIRDFPSPAVQPRFRCGANVSDPFRTYGSAMLASSLPARHSTVACRAHSANRRASEGEKK